MVVAVNMMGRVESQNPFHELDRHLLKVLGLLGLGLTRCRCNHKPRSKLLFISVAADSGGPIARKDWEVLSAKVGDPG